jgi:hypothetical protein
MMIIYHEHKMILRTILDAKSVDPEAYSKFG